MDNLRSGASAALHMQKAFKGAPLTLISILRSLMSGRPEEITFTSRRGTRICCPNNPSARAPIFEIFVDDTYHLGEFLEDAAPKHLLDIGSHVGAFALAVAERHPSTLVTCFEPSPTTFGFLAHNVRTNGLDDRVTTINAAIADTNGVLHLIDNGKASCVNALTATGSEAITVPVEGRALQDVLVGSEQPFDIVKIDSEGAEFSAILGTHPEAWETVDRVVLEYHEAKGRTWPDLMSFFERAGFHEVRHESNPRDPSVGTSWLRRL